MNTKSLSIAAALIAGVASFASSAALAADEYEMNLNMPAVVKTEKAATVAVARTPVVATEEYQRNQNLAVASTSKLQRAQVVAEAIEARKLGLLVGGEIGNLTPTPAQAEQIRLAGVRALGAQYAGK